MGKEERAQRFLFLAQGINSLRQELNDAQRRFMTAAGDLQSAYQRYDAAAGETEDFLRSAAYSNEE